MTSAMRNIAEKLRVLVDASPHSRRAVCIAGGLNPDTLANLIRREQQMPAALTVAGICDGLGVNVLEAATGKPWIEVDAPAGGRPGLDLRIMPAPPIADVGDWQEAARDMAPTVAVYGKDASATLAATLPDGRIVIYKPGTAPKNGDLVASTDGIRVFAKSCVGDVGTVTEVRSPCGAEREK